MVSRIRGDKGKFIKPQIVKGNSNLRPGSCNSNVPETQSHTTNEVEDGEDVSWRDGRRIVDLGELADNLRRCSGGDCDRVQDLRNTISEKRFGFGSLLWIKCDCLKLLFI